MSSSELTRRPSRRPGALARAALRATAAALAAVALLHTAACRAPKPSSEARWRAERAEAVRAELPPGARAAFQGLRFYPWDPAAKMRTVIQPIVPPQAVTMAASDGRVRPAHRVGRIHVRLPGGEADLTVYQLDDIRQQYPDHLFLPFRDAGAGTETYGAGRYVEIERLPGGVVEVDFNRAYNPDCAYGIVAQCPVTPPENTLPFAVRAGEMLPPGHD